MNAYLDISVVIPAYNSGAYIEETLSSVLRQTISPLEVIVIDDGSTDETSNIVDNYAQANPELRLHLIHSKHLGPGGARNLGIERARGEWIAFLDSDDLWFPTKLEAVASCHQSNNACNFFCHNELHRRLDGTEVVLDYAADYSRNDSLTRQLFRRNCFSTSAVVCKRSILIAAGLFDSTLPNAQDYELWIRMSPTIRVQFIQETLGVYVDRAGNITSTSHWSRYLNVIKVINKHRELVNSLLYIRAIAGISISYLRHWSFRSSLATLWRYMKTFENIRGHNHKH